MTIKSIVIFVFAITFSVMVRADFFVSPYNTANSSMTVAPPSTSGVAAKGVSIASVTVNNLDVGCGLFWKVQAGGNGNYPDYLHLILANEFQAAGIYDTVTPSIQLTIDFPIVALSAPKFFISGEWRLAVVIRSTNGRSLSVETSSPIKDFALDAQDGCRKSAASFPTAIGKLIDLIGNSPDYASLFQLTDAEQANWLTRVAEANEKARKEAEERLAKIAADKLARDAIEAAELAEVQQVFQKLAEVERKARTVCTDKPDCERKFALTQIFISERADMKIQLATDSVIETFNPTETFKVGAKAIKMPMKANTSEIRISFNCKPSEGAGRKSPVCERSKISLFESYVKYMSDGGN